MKGFERYIHCSSMYTLFMTYEAYNKVISLKIFKSKTHAIREKFVAIVLLNLFIEKYMKGIEWYMYCSSMHTLSMTYEAYDKVISLKIFKSKTHAKSNKICCNLNNTRRALKGLCMLVFWSFFLSTVKNCLHSQKVLEKLSLSWFFRFSSFLVFKAAVLTPCILSIY